MIAIAADYSPQKYASERQFVESLLGSVKIVAREKGWTGQRLVQAEWSDDAGALIVIDAGAGDVSVDDVRKMSKAHRARLKKLADEGRLV